MKSPSIRILILCCTAAGLLTGTGCSTSTGSTASPTAQSAFLYGKKKLQDVRKLPAKLMALMRRDGSFWDADDMTGAPSIRIDLGDQMVYFYKGGELAGGSPISSGREGYATRPGRYRIIEKDIDHKSSLYGDYEDYDGNVIVQNVDNRKHPRPAGTRFEGAKMNYFMRIYGGVGMHQGYLPGYAASHGCIRLPGNMAEKFYEATPMGTPVTIVP